MRLVSRNIVVESGIIDVFLIRAMFCAIFRVSVGVRVFRLTYIQQLGLGLGLELGLGLGLELGFVDTRKINYIC